MRGAWSARASWTHQYADAANKLLLVRRFGEGAAPHALWYRDSDFDMPQRHGRGPAPLYLDGRLFVEGLHGLPRRCLQWPDTLGICA